MKQAKVAAIAKECVACGNCIKYCPRQAIAIDRGIWAIVDENACVGCGKCERACPAGVISIIAKETVNAKKTMV